MSVNRNAREFPRGFHWGTATGAFQIEGAVAEDGRGPSIWDTFTHSPGKILDGSNADMTVDDYHRYKEDVQLMKALGVTAYRFSIAWPRVFPDGTGAANPKGLDFYKNLVDELLTNGIEPFATLYNCDLPQALQDRVGGWESRETALAFSDYAGFVAENLSDRVQNFFTINEFTSFVEYGYATGAIAPGLTLSRPRLNQVRHHAILAHGLAVQAIRANGLPGTRVGPADQMSIAVPIIEIPEHIRAAELATRDLNAGYMTAIMEGKYSDVFLKAQGADAPRFTDADMKAIGSPVDFVGLNVYLAKYYVRADTSDAGYVLIPYQQSHPVAKYPGTGGGFWLSPESMYWGPRHLARIWNVKDIYITENGVPFAHEPSPDGVDYDTDRIMYLRTNLTQLHRATSEGIPVRGYFHWSLMDNFEWQSGYQPRFGLYHVDYATQKRTPKLSASYFLATAMRNELM